MKIENLMLKLLCLIYLFSCDFCIFLEGTVKAHHAACKPLCDKSNLHDNPLSNLNPKNHCLQLSLEYVCLLWQCGIFVKRVSTTGIVRENEMLCE